MSYLGLHVVSPALLTLSVIAAPYNQIKPKTVKSGEFDYVKVFGEDQFTAAGLIRIRPRMSKPAKSSKDNAFVSTPCT